MNTHNLALKKVSILSGFMAGLILIIPLGFSELPPPVEPATDSITPEVAVSEVESDEAGTDSSDMIDPITGMYDGALFLATDASTEAPDDSGTGIDIDAVIDLPDATTTIIETTLETADAPDPADDADLEVMLPDPLILPVIPPDIEVVGSDDVVGPLAVLHEFLDALNDPDNETMADVIVDLDDSESHGGGATIVATDVDPDFMTDGDPIEIIVVEVALNLDDELEQTILDSVAAATEVDVSMTVITVDLDFNGEVEAVLVNGEEIEIGDTALDSVIAGAIEDALADNVVDTDAIIIVEAHGNDEGEVALDQGFLDVSAATDDVLLTPEELFEAVEVADEVLIISDSCLAGPGLCTACENAEDTDSCIVPMP